MVTKRNGKYNKTLLLASKAYFYTLFFLWEKKIRGEKIKMDKKKLSILKSAGRIFFFYRKNNDKKFV